MSKYQYLSQSCSVYLDPSWYPHYQPVQVEGRIPLVLLLIGGTIVVPPLPTSTEWRAVSARNLLPIALNCRTILLPPFASSINENEY